MKKETIIMITISTIVVLLISAGLFYWFALRPSQIKQACSKQAKSGHDEWYWNNYGNKGDDAKEYDNNYKNCLRDKGL